MIKQHIYITLIFLLFGTGLAAQQAKISGTVTNFDNSPVDFVSVSVQGSALGVFTNNQGKYQIAVPVGDSITIVFSRIGYQKTERKIAKVIGNMTINTMMRETVLEEVTVLGEKAQTSTMNKIEIGKTNLLSDPTGGSIESILALGAGVSSTNEMSSQYSVRGGNYDENIVYVNGIEIYRPLLIRSGQQEGLSFINPEMTKEVKFSTGGFESSYGDRMSSALDITYKKPQSFEASAAASLLGANAYIGSSSGRFTQITGFRYKTTRTLLGTLDTNAEYDPTFVDAQTYMTLGLSSKWEVGFMGNISSNVYKFTPKSRQTQFGSADNAKDFTVYFDGWENDKFLTYFGALSMKGKLSDNLEIEFIGSAFSSREYERYDISGEYKLTDLNLSSNGADGENGGLLAVGSYLEHARNSLNLDVTNIRHLGSFKVGKHALKWGLTLQQEKINDKIKEWSVRDSAGYSLPNLGDIVSVYSNLRSDNEITSTRYAAFLQDTYQFMSGDNIIYINAGIRASHWTFNDETIISPRGSIALIPDTKRDITLRFATGIYYQAPFYREYQKIVTKGQNSVIELNEDIKSQKSIHFVLGGDYKFRSMDRPFKFTSEVYYKKLSDLVPYTVDNVKIRYSGENSGTGYSMGWDMKLFGEFVKGSDSWISFSLMKTQQTVDGVQAPLPTDQRYNISLFFQDYFPGIERLTMNLRGHLSQGLPQAAPNSGFFEKGYFRTPAYRRLDIGFAWQALGEDFSIRRTNSFLGSFKNIWLGVDIFNLFDINNTNSYYWITNVFNQQFAVPNYLTGRQLNFKIVADF
ncbi:TonB-dependent receptor plug domain-containing protein [Dysgonomonas sp. HDW5B]|nr:TonB-dependent receptor [Dysgonomonas sp. HDW5B]QIK55582.1 TonB-dependent receptor plug domain-containing protein [Dysgonomonas sp. HDW5B]